MGTVPAKPCCRVAGVAGVLRRIGRGGARCQEGAPDLAAGRERLLQRGRFSRALRGCGRAEAMWVFLQYDVEPPGGGTTRVRGFPKVNPLGNPDVVLPELDPKYYGMTEEDMDLLFTSSAMS